MTHEPIGQLIVGPERTAYKASGAAPLEVVETLVQPKDRPSETWRYVRLNNDIPGAVALAVHDDKIAIAKQWRIALGTETFEFPRGRGTRDESTLETAMRELAEETGLNPTGGEVIGVVHPDSGTLSTRVAVVVVTVDGAEPRHETDGELSTWSWVPVSRLNTMIADGTLTDGISLAALQVWEARRFKQPLA